MFKNKKALNAVYLGVLCSVSYLAVYFARNILSVVTPQMLESGYKEAYIGNASSMYFMFYAVGQLINGMIGDKIKAKYMISIGLFMAGVTNVFFPYLANENTAMIVYGLTGYFLSMIYGPMTKIVAENTDLIYATRCSLGYTIASFLGSPLAGAIAMFMAWQSVFVSGTATLILMALIFFVVCTGFEKKGIVKYNQYKPQKEAGGGTRVLIKNRIIRFTFVSVLTGIVRTTVVFWLPTYISQRLGFSADEAAGIFTVSTFVIASSAFVAVFIYERLGRNMDLTLLISFAASAAFFALTYIVGNPIINIACLVLGIVAADSAATMLWSRYCPGLRDTGMVSGATGYLDFMSYMAAGISSTIFANAVSVIGWGNLVLIWTLLMILGVIIMIPMKKRKKAA